MIVGLSMAGCTPGNGSRDDRPNAVDDNRNAVSGMPTPTLMTSPPAAAERRDEMEGAAGFNGTVGVTEKENKNVTELASLSAVRTARHDGYDRAVFEFAGAEMPTYHIEYISKPASACGSGFDVPTAGNAVLEVRFTNAVAHTDEGEPTIADRERKPGLPVIRELKSTCDFEGEVTWVLGTASKKEYRVMELKSPTRLVVDIKH